MLAAIAYGHKKEEFFSASKSAFYNPPTISLRVVFLHLISSNSFRIREKCWNSTAAVRDFIVYFKITFTIDFLRSIFAEFLKHFFLYFLLAERRWWREEKLTSVANCINFPFKIAPKKYIVCVFHLSKIRKFHWLWYWSRFKQWVQSFT